MKITLTDFIKIFKNDKVSERLIKIINNEIMVNRLIHQDDNLHKPPSRMISHPSLMSPKGSQRESSNNIRPNSKHITVTMKAQDKMIEIPLDENCDQLSIH